MKINKVRIYLLALVNLIVYTASGQIVKVANKEKIGDQKNMFYAVLNEKGDKILFTDANYKGLKLYDLSTRKIMQISESDGAGFEPVFDENTGKIIHRETRFIDRRKYQSVQQFNPVNRQKSELVSTTRNLKTTLPVSIRATSKKISDIQVYSNAQSIVLNTNGQEKILKPFAENEVSGYIWASLSPDKNRIPFYAAGKGTYIADLTGKVISFLGNIQSPHWFNENLVVGMDARNNEYVYTSSRILIVSADGKLKQYLTDEKEMAMYPSASSQAGKIAYNTYEGDIYILTVKSDIK